MAFATRATTKLQARRTAAPRSRAARRTAVRVAAGAYDAELCDTASKIASPGKGILAMDESNKTAGLRLASIGVENTEDNRRRYRELLLSAPGIGNYCGGAILFEETLYQNCVDGKTSMVDLMGKQGIIPGIKVDTGLVPMCGANEGETWCQGLDGLKERTAKYYEAGARFAKWRSAVNIAAGASDKAVFDCAYGLARYAKICQDSGLVPIVEPEILLDGTHGIDETYEIASKVWALTFKCLADQDVMFEGILLKPSMVTPGADCPDRASSEEIAAMTLKMLNNRIPPAVPGIMFLSGGQSELEATMNLNSMNQSPNPWHVSFSYARALQNSTLKAWMGEDANIEAAHAALLKRASANSAAQMGKYDPSIEDESAKEGMFQANYQY